MKIRTSIPILVIGCLLCCSACNKENETPPPSSDKEIPDAVFKAYCFKNFDTDGDGQISESEANSVSEISLQDINVNSLAGIGQFSHIQAIRCKNVQIVGNVDLTKNTKLTIIDFDRSAINGTCTLGSYPELVYLHIYNAKWLATCDLRESVKLDYLFIEFDNAQKIELGDKPQLRSLSLRRGVVSDTTSIDFRLLPQLEYLDMRGMQGKIGKVNLRGLLNLKTFYYGVLDPTREAPNTLWNLSACRALEGAEIKGVKGSLSLDLSPNNRLKRFTCHYTINKTQAGFDIKLPENGCLDTLDLVGMRLKELDLSAQSALQYLRINDNAYQGTPELVWPAETENQLAYFSYTNNTAEQVDVTSLPGLKTLLLNKNRLIALNLSKNRALERLECTSNWLDWLNLDQNSRLQVVKLNDNPDLKTITLPAGEIALDSIEIEQTPVEVLDISRSPRLRSVFAGSATRLATVYVNDAFRWTTAFKFPDFTHVFRKISGEEITPEQL